MGQQYLQLELIVPVKTVEKAERFFIRFSKMLRWGVGSAQSPLHDGAFGQFCHDITRDAHPMIFIVGGDVERQRRPRMCSIRRFDPDDTTAKEENILFLVF